MTAKQPPHRRQFTPTVLALTLSLFVGNVAQGQTADEINAAILTNLGLTDAATGQLSAEHQAGLTDFTGRTRVFADDLDRALRAETVAEGRLPREAAENPSLADLHDLLQGLDQEQLVTVITGYVPGADTSAALARAFADVLPPHLGARRAELEVEFFEGFYDVLVFSLTYAHRNSTSFILETRVDEYTDITAQNGVYSAIITLFEEISVPAVEVMTEPQFYAFLDAFSRARARGEYSGDDAEYFGEDVIGVFQVLYSGDDIPGMFRTLVIPMLDESTSQLHPRLLAIYNLQLELERITAERERITAERERITAERARMEDLVAAREETLRILGLTPAEN
ncbi:MAG: hypothetical protein JJU15_00110 [Pararhodobacter sp.]|nr:hypothetical protein [Pararhodobacter sp.]